jgi:hypothetical protein
LRSRDSGGWSRSFALVCSLLTAAYLLSAVLHVRWQGFGLLAAFVVSVIVVAFLITSARDN